MAIETGLMICAADDENGEIVYLHTSVFGVCLSKDIGGDSGDTLVVYPANRMTEYVAGLKDLFIKFEAEGMSNFRAVPLTIEIQQV